MRPSSCRAGVNSDVRKRQRTQQAGHKRSHIHCQSLYLSQNIHALVGHVDVNDLASN